MSPARPLDGHQARKRFGQHFLADNSVIEAIVAAIAPRAGQCIVEIGPGLAALTAALLARIEHVHAIEIDRDLAARLRRRWGPQRLSLHEADALAFDFAGLAAQIGAAGAASVAGATGATDAGAAPARLRVVGNLPYNISSPLLIHLLSFRHCIIDQHFMLQKEVVDRIVAEPGGADYGRLSVLLQAFYEVESLFVVPPEAFDPPPRVDSAVVRMIVREAPTLADPQPLQQVLAAAFSQRRKMLRKTLLPWLAERGVAADGIDATQRAEDLPVAVWIDLAQRLAASRD